MRELKWRPIHTLRYSRANEDVLVGWDNDSDMVLIERQEAVNMRRTWKNPPTHWATITGPGGKRVPS